MDDRQARFIISVLGEAGATALRKATERSLELEQALLPRAIYAWLNAESRLGFSGELPGAGGAFAFQKSEHGFTGSLSLSGTSYQFQDQPLFHVAAAVALALGVELDQQPKIRIQHLERLGKSLDTLVKARVALHKAELAKAAPPKGDGYTYQADWDIDPDEENAHEHVLMVRAFHGKNPIGSAQFTTSSYRSGTRGGVLTPAQVVVHPEHRRKGIATRLYQEAERASGRKVIPSNYQTDAAKALWAANEKGKWFGKVELPGQTHKPTPQQEHQAPVAPEKQQGEPKPLPRTTKLPKPPKPRVGLSLPKLPSLKLGKSEMTFRCQVCGRSQFANVEYVGCLCFADLAKSVTVSPTPDGVLLRFGRDWDHEAILTLAESVRRK